MTSDADSASRLLATLDSLMEGFQVLDRDLRYVYLNEAAVRHAKRPRELLLGRTMSECYPGIEATPLYDALGRCLLEGTPHRMDNEFRYPDGSISWFELSLQSQPMGVTILSIDISSRKAVEESLRRERDAFQRLTETSPVGITQVDRKGKIVFANASAERILRLDRGQIVSREYNALQWRITDHAGNPIPDDELPFQQVRHARRPVADVRHAVHFPEGGRVLLSVNAAPLVSDGEFDGMVAVFDDVTERTLAQDALRRSEEALRGSERQLRSFVDQAPAAIAMYDREMVCLAASSRWVAAWGRGRDDLVGLCHYALHPDIPDEWREIHARGLAGETLQNDEDKWVQADGSVCWVRWLVQPWRDLAGELGGIMILAEDITAQKQEQEALVAERALLRTVFDLLPDLIYVKDTQHRFIASNEACARHMGASSPAELLGKTDAEFYPPAVEAELREDERGVLEGRPVFNKKEVFSRAHERPRSFLTTKVPLTDGRGTIRGLVGTGRDVTEREAAGQRLRTQHAVTRALAAATSLADAAPAIIRTISEMAGGVFGALWDVDRQARVLRCTALWHRDDLAADELAAQTRDMVFAPGAGLPGRVWSSRQPVVLADLAADGEFLRKDAAGRAGLHGAFGFPILVRNEVAGVIDFLGREMREPDRELQDLLVGIGTQIGQFIEHQRAEEQVIQSQKMEAIGQLAGGIAHDFNNLLGVIIAYGDLAKRELAEHAAWRRVDGMQKAAERAAALTRQILTFSRKQPTAPRVCDLNAIVEDMEKMLRRLIGEDIRLVVVLGPELGRVKVEPSQLEQVILNLAVNARDAMPTGGRLVIETADILVEHPVEGSGLEMRPGPYVLLTVADTGHGMSAETASRIYEPFFTTKEQGKGTGLGMAVVYGVVKQSGGSISVYSEPGRGTTFKVFLPRTEEEEAKSVPETGAAPGGTETILVVEDEDALREIVAEVLTTEGYHVLEAGDPKSALVIAAQAGLDIDLVVTDVVLPGQSGPQTAAQIRARHPKAKVLLVSGYTDKLLDGQRSVEPGTPFLGKPFTPDQLLWKVREVLGSE